MSRTAVVLAMAASGCLLGGTAAFAECAPAKLVKITTANVSPALPADSFAGKPKVMYRFGNGKVRLEELAAGSRLVLLVDDPRAMRDIPRAAEAHGYAVIDVVALADGWRIEIER